MKEKIEKIIELAEEYNIIHKGYYKLEISLYGGEIVANLKPLDWEYYGDTLETLFDEIIEDITQAIKDRDEEEREARVEMEHQERIYWERQLRI